MPLRLAAIAQALQIIYHSMQSIPYLSWHVAAAAEVLLRVHIPDAEARRGRIIHDHRRLIITLRLIESRGFDDAVAAEEHVLTYLEGNFLEGTSAAQGKCQFAVIMPPK